MRMPRFNGFPEPTSSKARPRRGQSIFERYPLWLLHDLRDSCGGRTSHDGDRLGHTMGLRSDHRGLAAQPLNMDPVRLPQRRLWLIKMTGRPLARSCRISRQTWPDFLAKAAARATATTCRCPPESVSTA